MRIKKMHFVSGATKKYFAWWFLYLHKFTFQIERENTFRA